MRVALTTNLSYFTPAVQERLDNLGFWVPDYDGVLGSVTSQALLAFQKSVGLPLTGQVDEYTALLLNMEGLRSAGQSTSGLNLKAFTWMTRNTSSQSPEKIIVDEAIVFRLGFPAYFFFWYLMGRAA